MAEERAEAYAIAGQIYATTGRWPDTVRLQMQRVAVMAGAPEGYPSQLVVGEFDYPTPPPEPHSGWRPIVPSTLPDKLLALVLVADWHGQEHIVIAEWHKGANNYSPDGWWSLMSEVYRRHEPTHWMPLPPHPHRRPYVREPIG